MPQFTWHPLINSIQRSLRPDYNFTDTKIILLNSFYLQTLSPVLRPAADNTSKSCRYNIIDNKDKILTDTSHLAGMTDMKWESKSQGFDLPM